jgi:1-acyl-sn-glycerol-3-phosphate acyltransferase
MRVFIWPKDIQGLENLKGIQGPLIISANHRGRFDGIWIWYYLALMNRTQIVNMRIITGEIFFTKPILGWYLRQMQCFPVGRGMGIQVLDPMVDVLNDTGIVTIFPEGKMQKHPNHRGDAKRGVGYLIWKSQAPVLPIYINYTKPWKYIPIWNLTLHIGEIISYDVIQSEDAIQKVADDVLESIYKLDTK